MSNNSNSLYKINIFDDGNEKYKQYQNIWEIYSVWKGKVSLINNKNNDIKITSISAWKIYKI
jgi:hypothetical protein